MQADAPNSKKHIPRDACFVEALAWLLAIAALVATALRIPHMPDTIPTHFGMDGLPDGWGSPASSLVLPVIILITNAIISLVIHLTDPKTWNRPASLTAEKEPAWHRASMRMAVWIELECSVFCLLLQLDLADGNAYTAIPLAGGLLLAMGITIAAAMIAWKHS